MKLTCVTAVFNAVKSGNRENLIRCVKSVAALKTEHEHLIYDGASTDGTVELLRELEATTPDLKVVSEPDTGIYNALNKGVRDAKGEWFYVLGSDDYICHPEVMDRLIASVKDEDLLVSPVHRDGEEYQYHKLDDLKWIFIRHAYCHQGVLCRTQKVRSFRGFDEKYLISADGDLCLKFHLSGLKIKYACEEYAYFSPGGTCESNNELIETENCSFIAQRVGLSEDQIRFYRQHGFHCAIPMLRYSFASDEALRRGARYMLRLWGKYYLRAVLYPLVLLRRHIRSQLI